MPQQIDKINFHFRNKNDYIFHKKARKMNAEGEIRTPVARGATGFQDRRRGPLGYLSRLNE
jgi:hypothetical protein